MEFLSAVEQDPQLLIWFYTSCVRLPQRSLSRYILQAPFCTVSSPLGPPPLAPLLK